MKNKDAMNMTQLEIAQRISNAAKEGNTEEFEAGLQDLFQNIHDEIVGQARELQANADAAALAQRGVRILTSEEMKFYKGLIDAMKAGSSGNVMMALSDTDKTFPLTIINQAMEDMKQEHPLLDVVDTVSATGLMKFLVNTDEGDNATWGELESAITKEITSGFADIEMGQFKLSAWMPISQDMLELGPNWLDSYIRTCLSEALAIGFENGIVSGTGKNMPIGMDRQVGAGVVVTDGVYPKKEASSVTRLDPTTYGVLLSRISKTANGKQRPVRDLVLVVNPTDYFKVIMPATTGFVNGQYVNDILPYPTRVIVSVAVPVGDAILGMGKRYFLGIGGKRGIQFSDDYKFLEDKRYYKIVAYANGRPKDNNAFQRLDISGLKRFVQEYMAVNSDSYLLDIEIESDVNQTVFGKAVNTLQTGVQVVGGDVLGTLKYVTGFTGFSGDPELQSGNYLALSFNGNQTVTTDSTPDKITVELVNARTNHGPQTLDSDKDICVRITDQNLQYLEVKAYKGREVTTRILKLDRLVLETAQ